jgi:hypothetical protein
MSDEGLEKALDRHKAEWEAGRFDRIIPAFMFCVKNRLTMPDWLYNAVRDDLQFAYLARQRGGPSARTGAVQDHQNRVHGIRHLMMRTALEQQAWEIERGIRQAENKREAARLVRQMLAHSESPARGSADAILESFNPLEKGGK